jgi:hypothetical protein
MCLFNIVFFSSPASFDSKTVHVRLPVIEKVTELWNFLEILFEELMCCENFYTSQHLVGACSKCSKQGLQSVAGKKGEFLYGIQKQIKLPYKYFVEEYLL